MNCFNDEILKMLSNNFEASEKFPTFEDYFEDFIRNVSDFASDNVIKDFKQEFPEYFI